MPFHWITQAPHWVWPFFAIAVGFFGLAIAKITEPETLDKAEDQPMQDLDSEVPSWPLIVFSCFLWLFYLPKAIKDFINKAVSEWRQFPS